MGRQYSIAEARNHLSELVHEAESEGPVTLTRHGRPVAVVVSEPEYRQLREARRGFWDAAAVFRESVDLGDLAVRDVYRNVRDRGLGREVTV